MLVALRAGVNVTGGGEGPPVRYALQDLVVEVSCSPQKNNTVMQLVGMLS